MDLFYGCCAALFGLVIGSFLNVCIFRLPAGESVAAGRSHCQSCGHTIRWYDLVPVVSYLLLGGRCRDCGARISPRYPAVEALNALLWTLAYVRYGISARGILCCAALSLLIVVAGIDHDTGLIYDRFPLLLAALGLLACFLVRPPALSERLIGAVCVSLPMLLLALLCGGFGGGDVKLTAACGLLLGWKAMLLAAVLACLSGGAAAAVLLLSRRAGRGSEMPFGPYLALGIGFALLYADPVIGWYASLLH